MICRSYLFVPGNRPDRFEKARQSRADAVILDLEDSVQSTHKDLAREAVASWLKPARPAYVRINAEGTPWFERDLEVVGLPGVLGVVLPKAERPEQVAKVAARLTGEAGVVPLVETALGIWNARALAQAPLVERLAFGAVDFMLDTGISGEQEDVVHARRLGFRGKLCIHPKQVETINRGFVPTEAELAWARRVLEAADSTGVGALRLDGELIDRPVIERARSILTQGELFA